MSLNYSRTVRNAGPSSTAPDGFTDARWHLDASGDTGSSHMRVGRVYVVQCEWCEEAYAGTTAVEAMAMFREHEEKMLAEGGEEVSP